MERNYIATGKTIDIAIQAALNALNMDRDSVSVEVLENAKSGFLGIGASPAKVKVTYEVPDEPGAPSPALSAASRSKPKREVPAAPAAKVVDLPKAAPKPQPPKPERPERPERPEHPERPERPERLERPADPRRNGSKPNKPKNAPRPEAAAQTPRQDKPRPEKPRQDKPKQDKPRPEAPASAQPTPAPVQPAKPRKEYTQPEPGSTEERIEQFILGLLRQMGSEAVPQAVKTEEDIYHVELVGENLGMLIGRRGDTLDAIQHLTNYAINRDAVKRSRINVDAESYRDKREESLQRLALKVAGKVTRYRRNITLEPMNAYERHVIHAALQNEPDVSTFSTGAEPNRRVVVSFNRAHSGDAPRAPRSK